MRSLPDQTDACGFSFPGSRTSASFRWWQLQQQETRHAAVSPVQAMPCWSFMRRRVSDAPRPLTYQKLLLKKQL